MPGSFASWSGSTRIRSAEPGLRRSAATDASRASAHGASELGSGRAIPFPLAGSRLPPRLGLAAVAVTPDRPVRLPRGLNLRWAAVGMAAAVVLLAALLSWARVGDQEQLYASVVQTAARPDLLSGRARLLERHPELVGEGMAVLRGTPDGESRGEPDGVAFLAGERIEYRGRPVSGAAQRYQVLLNGRLLAADLPGPRYAARAPAAPGSHAWTMLTMAGDRAAAGEFIVLGREAAAVAVRARRELAGDPRRLAAVYVLLGLEQQARAVVEQHLPAAERAAERRRLGLLEGPRKQ